MEPKEVTAMTEDQAMKDAAKAQRLIWWRDKGFTQEQSEWCAFGFEFGWVAKAERDREEMESMRKLLGRAMSMLPELGAHHEEPRDAWTNHPAISYVEIQVEKSTLVEAKELLADYAKLKGAK